MAGSEAVHGQRSQEGIEGGQSEGWAETEKEAGREKIRKGNRVGKSEGSGRTEGETGASLGGGTARHRAKT